MVDKPESDCWYLHILLSSVGTCLSCVYTKVTKGFSKSHSHRDESMLGECFSQMSVFSLQLGPVPFQVNGKTIDCSRLWPRLLATFVLNLKVMCIYCECL